MEEDPNSPGALVVEVEIPPLTLLAEPTTARGADQQRDLGATLRELGEPQPARDAWDLAPRASTAAAAQECGEASEASDGIVRFRCELPLPGPGQSRLYRLSVRRAHTAADGSGARWNTAPHPTEEELLAIAATTAGEGPAAATPPERQLPDRAGRARRIPGVNVLHVALSPHGDVTRAWLDGAGAGAGDDALTS